MAVHVAPEGVVTITSRPGTPVPETGVPFVGALTDGGLGAVSLSEIVMVAESLGFVGVIDKSSKSNPRVPSFVVVNLIFV